jgi:long-chain acyl-CoA synthetase
MGTDGVTYELHDGVASLGLNRPHKRNALNSELMIELEAAIRRAQADARALVIFGHGPCFSAGLDLTEHSTRQPAEAFHHSRAWHATFSLLSKGNIPSIAALHGATIGGGLELAAACNIRVADETAFFALPEGTRGIYVGGGASVFVARLFGASRMTDMMLTGRVLDAAAAERAGLVQYLVSKDGAKPKAGELAAKVSAMAPLTVLGVLHALPRIQDMSAADGLFVESLMVALAQTGQEAGAGLADFAAKRAVKVAAPPQEINNDHLTKERTMQPGLSQRGAGEPRVPAATLCDMFDHAVASAPETVALRHLEVALTYRELGRAVTSLAQRLSEMLTPGEVVGLVLPNSTEFHVSYFAALKALAVPALLNPLYPEGQLSPLLQEAKPRVLLCSPATQKIVANLARDLGIPGLLSFGRDITVAELVTKPEDPVGSRIAAPADSGVLLFSGGTTGLPKAVEHTHGRLVAAVRSMEYIWPARNSGEVFLPIAPFTHVYGFMQGVLAPLSACGETVIPERFQPEHIVDLLARYRVTFFGGGPPAIYAGVLAAGNLASADLSALRVCPAGGAPFPIELMERWQRATGIEIHEAYGMTELGPISGINALSGLRPGSVGKPVPGTEVQVVDLDSGLRVLPPGEKGELRVRGPHMMTHYRNQPQETAQTLRDGFMYTGDVGHLDEDGFVFITDRKKDVVFVKGFNVFPREVEEVIHTHPEVDVVGVVGVAEARSGGERLVAFVVPQKGKTIDSDDISAYCSARLVGYKCPTEVRVVTQLPTTGAQKLDRVALRRLAAGGPRT